jgi:hypothetical protein
MVPLFVIVMDVPAFGIIIASAFAVVGLTPSPLLKVQLSLLASVCVVVTVPDPGHAALASPDAASSISTATRKKTIFFISIKRLSAHAG